ncbi:(2Fe-2S)-binding protein [Erythrobacteraceae bacterium CFH 75059]|uniref:(2Fe-2S)-binding protein n=1 Tax=Qipengyuania thermophila TaxID=2509361 RepID=UPI0010226F33|nr:(2Fe-2S)-binding protein [Qipengyuania thermophila]TCD04102.1 (2Fe-2S)-binding protein [Erythrobacteraceae bacterium CFH 75059]
MPRMTVNGRPLEFLMDGRTPLLWALRDAANLTGTKYGCGVGDCWACTVHVDGQALRSCLVTLDEAEGRAITTIEGVSRDGPNAVQRALIEVQAIQCGFCTPGIVMALTALLRASPSPTRAQIEAALPHLCRCGVQPRLYAAVELAVRAGGGAIAAETAAAAPADPDANGTAAAEAAPEGADQ